MDRRPESSIDVPIVACDATLTERGSARTVLLPLVACVALARLRLLLELLAAFVEGASATFTSWALLVVLLKDRLVNQVSVEARLFVLLLA